MGIRNCGDGGNRSPCKTAAGKAGFKAFLEWRGKTETCSAFISPSPTCPLTEPKGSKFNRKERRENKEKKDVQRPDARTCQFETPFQSGFFLCGLRTPVRLSHRGVQPLARESRRSTCCGSSLVCR